MQPIAEINQGLTPASAVGLPKRHVPTIPPVSGDTGPIKSYILPDGKTGAVSNISASTLSPILTKVSRCTSALLLLTTPNSSSSMSNLL